MFLWSTRIKNALGDDTMSTGGTAIAVVTSVVFIAAAVGLVFAHWRGLPRAGRAAAGFAVVSIGYWLIRLGVIVARDHSVGFTLVHAALALITIGLATWVLRSATGSARRPDLARTPA